MDGHMNNNKKMSKIFAPSIFDFSPFKDGGCAHIYASVVLYVLAEHNILCCTFTTPRRVAEFPHHSRGTSADTGQKLHWSWPRVQHEYRWRLWLSCFWNHPQQFLHCLHGLDPVLCYKTQQGGHPLALRMKCLMPETWLLFIWLFNFVLQICEVFMF